MANIGGAQSHRRRIWCCGRKQHGIRPGHVPALRSASTWNKKNDSNWMNALKAGRLGVENIDFVMCSHL
jgi:hypothetical protein